MTHQDQLGINAVELVLLAPSDAKRVLEEIAAFGFKHVRFGVPWLLIEPVKGQQNWGNTTYNGQTVAGVQLIVSEAKRLGLTLLPILGVHMPAWTWIAKDFGEFCRRAHVTIGAPVYEVMNEPNLHAFNPFANAAPIAPLIVEAKKNITAQIAFPGLAAAETYAGWGIQLLFGFIPWPYQYRNASPEDFLRDSLALNVGPHFDVMNYHPYALKMDFSLDVPSATQPMIKRSSGLHEMSGKSTIIGTEWGFDIAKIGVPETARRIGIQMPLMHDRFDRHYLFAWRDDARHGGTFGIVDTANKPRKEIADVVKAALLG
jgi:hypothetical protein